MNYTFDLLKYAYIRGYMKIKMNVNNELTNKDIFSLTSDDFVKLEKIGKDNNLKLYYFKEKDDLPRVNVVLGFFKSVYPTSILDIGSGRGVFLFPLLRDFSYANITSLDILEKRVELLNLIKIGGVNNLDVYQDDICTYDVCDNSYEVVTMLEVLEHIPNAFDAVKNACRIASRFIVVTVPSKEDDNPEHIHLLTKEKLIYMFNQCGVTNLKFGGVNGHLFLVARK